MSNTSEEAKQPSELAQLKARQVSLQHDNGELRNQLADAQRERDDLNEQLQWIDQKLGRFVENADTDRKGRICGSLHVAESRCGQIPLYEKTLQHDQARIAERESQLAEAQAVIEAFVDWHRMRMIDFIEKYGSGYEPPEICEKAKSLLAPGPDEPTE